ncbi:glycosyltransferase [Halomicronema sp. CCY15110]|uniref:glycosyltransferase n=1 Tax=Halomicronema sp. CCY15110 TaxID=2767773 RepID=UPI00194ED1B6|nr:glycosyltransferase [Halomicronema sp. CCY15110]
MTPIKVLFFSPSLGHGGAEMHLLRVMNALDRQGFAPSVAVAQAGGSYEAALADDVPLHSLNSPAIRSSTIRMIRAIRPLRQLIQTTQPDIVCAFQSHANLAAIRACQGLPQRPKLIVCAQNSPFAQYQRAWHPLDRLMLKLMAQMYPQADRLIALSQGVAQELNTLVGPLPTQRRPPIDLIYNAGVDQRVTRGARQGKHLRDGVASNPVLVTCGRLHPQKGYPYLLAALAKVRREIPVQLWIVGDGPQRPAIARQIRALGLTDAVQLWGFQANPFQFMAAADGFVLSSLYEGFGNVLVEAMACGVPIIATDCPHGPAEILERGRNGLLARPADADDLARQMLKLLRHPQLREKFARRGLVRSQQFHADTIAQAYAQAFSRALTAAPAR